MMNGEFEIVLVQIFVNSQHLFIHLLVKQHAFTFNNANNVLILRLKTCGCFYQKMEALCNSASLYRLV